MDMQAQPMSAAKNAIYYIPSLFAEKWQLAIETDTLEDAHKIAETIRRKHRMKGTMIIPGCGPFPEELERKFPSHQFVPHYQSDQEK